MQLPESSPYVLGLNEAGERQRLSGGAGSFVSYVGYDRDRRRLVEINGLGSEESLDRHRWRSLQARLSLAKRLQHPLLSQVLDSDLDEAGELYYVSEFIEGEPLVDYLGRFTHFPRHLGVHLALQLAEATGYLADFPRLLATVALDDFVVTLDRERFLCLRLAHLGFDRDDAPVSDAVLGAHWIETVGQLLRHLLEGQPLPNPSLLAAEAAGTGSLLDGPLGRLISRLKSEPGSAAIRELKQLKSTLLEAAGLTGKNDLHRQPEFRAIEEAGQRPSGSLSLLVEDSGEFETLTREQWRLRHDGFPVDGASFFSRRARSPRDPSATLGERGDCYDLVLLPPERLVGGAFLPRLNRQMGDAFLKDHPYLVRTRSVICYSDFTLVAAEGVNGFSLMTLVTARGGLSPVESALIFEEIVRLLAHLEGIELELDRLDPWRLVFHFENAPGEERIRELVSTVPLTAWPPLTLRLRPLSTTESLIDPEAGPWRHLRRRLGGKSLPALLAWMMEVDRFEEELAAGRADTAPLHYDPQIAGLLDKAGACLDTCDPAQRQRFLTLFRELTEAIETGESNPTAADQREDERSSQRRGWRLRRPLSAA